MEFGTLPCSRREMTDVLLSRRDDISLPLLKGAFWFTPNRLLGGAIYNDTRPGFSDGKEMTTSRVLWLYTTADGRGSCQTLNTLYRIELLP